MMPSTTPLSPNAYIQHIYNIGEIPENRPDFDDLLGKQVSHLEKWIRSGPNQPLAIIQARIRSVPALAALLGSQASEGSKLDEKRFVTGSDGKRLLRLYPIEDIYAF